MLQVGPPKSGPLMLNCQIPSHSVSFNILKHECFSLNNAVITPFELKVRWLATFMRYGLPV